MWKDGNDRIEKRPLVKSLLQHQTFLPLFPPVLEDWSIGSVVLNKTSGQQIFPFESVHA